METWLLALCHLLQPRCHQDRNIEALEFQLLTGQITGFNRLTLTQRLRESFWASSPHIVQQFSLVLCLQSPPVRELVSILAGHAEAQDVTQNQCAKFNCLRSLKIKNLLTNWGNYFVFIWTQENHFTVSGIALHPWVTWVTTFPGKQRRLDGLLPSSVRRWSWVQQQWSPTNDASVLGNTFQVREIWWNFPAPFDFLVFWYL